MTKITTPEATLSYENLFEPSAPDGSFAEPQYSACLVFNKEADLSELEKAVEDAGKLKWGEKFSGMKKSGEIRVPFRNDRLTEKGYPPDSTYINVRSKQKPGIVSTYAGEDGKPLIITNRSEIYSGCLVRATLFCFAYDKAGNKGISFSLNNLQKLADGPRLDGRLKAEDDFEVLESNPVHLEDVLG